MRTFSVLVSSFIAVGTAFPAGAQDSESSVRRIEEVIVSASRRDESLKDVPAAVVVIDPEEFVLAGLTSVEDIVRYTPGVFYNDGGRPGRGTITARGIPQFGTTPTFSTYIDDTPLNSNTPYNQGAFISSDGLLLDVERVEVVKGPQGTLFGATSVGGMLRYITRKPALDEFRGTVGFDYSSVSSGGDGNIINGRVSIPVMENKLGVTLAGFRQETPAYVDRVDPATGEVIASEIESSDIDGFAADILYVPSDRVELRLKYSNQDTSADGANTVQLAGLDTTDSAFTSTEFGALADVSPIDLSLELLSASIDIDLGWATLTSSTSDLEQTQDISSDYTAQFAPLTDFLFGLPPGTTTSVVLESPLTTEKFTQEFRLTSNDAGDNNFEWLGGVYYSKEEGTNVQDAVITPALPGGGLFFADFPSEYEELAFFGNVTYYLTENFDVTVGLRHTQNDVKLGFLSDGVLSVGFGPPISSTQSIDDDVTTYLFNARYRPTENVSLYTRIATGYRGPAPNFPIVDPFTGELVTVPVVDSDEMTSYELGVKGTAFDGVVDYDVAVWYSDYENFQANFSINGLGVLANSVGGLDAKGFEGAFIFNVSDSFFVDVNVGYTDSSLKQDEPGFGGIGGAQYPGIPEWKASARFNYQHNFSGDWVGSATAGVRYVDEFTSGFNTTQSIAGTVDARTVVDMNLGLSNGRYHFGLYATNLTDTRKLTTRSDSVLGVDPFTGEPLLFSTGSFVQPRTIGANLRFDF